MKDLQVIQKRFLKEEPRMRLGHLASDLSRAAFFMTNGLSEQAKDILEEIKYLTEWTARSFDPNIQALLAEIQSQMALDYFLWEEVRRDPVVLQSVVTQLKAWANELLREAGLARDDRI